MTYWERIEVFEANMILDALEESECVVSRAAVILGLPRETLLRKMEKFQLYAKDIRAELIREWRLLNLHPESRKRNPVRCS